jgi:hypothetical protein
MALARADMSARNNLKLNAFVTLVYQKLGVLSGVWPPTV